MENKELEKLVQDKIRIELYNRINSTYDDVLDVIVKKQIDRIEKESRKKKMLHSLIQEEEVKQLTLETRLLFVGTEKGMAEVDSLLNRFKKYDTMIVEQINQEIECDVSSYSAIVIVNRSSEKVDLIVENIGNWSKEKPVLYFSNQRALLQLDQLPFLQQMRVASVKMPSQFMPNLGNLVLFNEQFKGG